VQAEQHRILEETTLADLVQRIREHDSLVYTI